MVIQPGVLQPVAYGDGDGVLDEDEDAVLWYPDDELMGESVVLQSVVLQAAAFESDVPCDGVLMLGDGDEVDAYDEVDDEAYDEVDDKVGDETDGEPSDETA